MPLTQISVEFAILKRGCKIRLLDDSNRKKSGLYRMKSPILDVSVPNNNYNNNRRLSQISYRTCLSESVRELAFSRVNINECVSASLYVVSMQAACRQRNQYASWTVVISPSIYPVTSQFDDDSTQPNESPRSSSRLLSPDMLRFALQNL